MQRVSGFDQQTHTPDHAPAENGVLCVLLNYRTAAMTLRAADSARSALEGLSGHIVIVDNDSQDGSFEQMQQHVADAEWSGVTVIQSGHNGGFGAGNNFGIRAGLALPIFAQTPPEFIYILNSDAFPETEAIHALISHMTAHPDVGFAGSLIYGEDGLRHLTTFRFPSLASEFEGAVRLGPVSRALANTRVPMDMPDNLTEARDVDWLAGASLMMRRSMLDQIGVFDERYFLYFEETDLSLRGQRAGYRIAYVPTSRVMHIGSVSTGMGKWQRTPRYWFRSRWYYFVKNHGRIAALGATLVHLMGGIIHRLRSILQNKPSADPHRFLFDLASHDAIAALRPTPAPQIATIFPATNQPNKRSED
jgi:GT2 family glycosyltransferase